MFRVTYVVTIETFRKNGFKSGLVCSGKKDVEHRPTQTGQGDSIIFEETVNQVGVFNRYLKRGKIQNGAITRGNIY